MALCYIHFKIDLFRFCRGPSALIALAMAALAATTTLVMAALVAVVALVKVAIAFIAGVAITTVALSNMALAKSTRPCCDNNGRFTFSNRLLKRIANVFSLPLP